ncbi:hypothetical protein BDN71DRAFT_1437587 [Pleurotus eryngii]|uniref:Uncharacterized protein n=1 Tax=Pleurotus eryngii TaxID=5323 RepID=A0A9P6DCW1_PLEER|nr:hypothetical protein BDN71DRAFT_1437587 [Pleurotus eryngii]
MPGPTQVQNPPNDNFAQGHGHGHDLNEKSRNEVGPMSTNAQLLHKEALRMALGSILNPKRPYTPSSRSSSGTASPAYPYSFHHSPVPGTPSIPPAPHPTPSSGRFSESHLSPFPYHPHPQPHLPHALPPLSHTHSHHVPSPLSQLDAQSSPQDGDQVSHSQRNSPTHSGAASPTLSQAPGTLSDASITAPANPQQEHSNGPVHAPAPMQGAVVVTDEGSSSSEKSKVTFIQTLQSKSAWEALIHGSFS